MIVQILLGGWIARKIWKKIEQSRDARLLAECGQKLGFPMIPGEPIEQYRKRLLAVRDAKK